MPPPSRSRPRIRVTLSPTALLPALTVRTASAFAIAQLGVGALFVAGVAGAAVGTAAGWLVLAVVLLGAAVRAIDIESWALLIGGGFAGRVREAFGDRAARLGTAAVLIERVVLGALASVVLGHHATSFVVTFIAERRFARYVQPEDLATLLAVATVALVWIPARISRHISRDALARGVWIAIAILATTVVWGLATALRHGSAAFTVLASLPPLRTITGWPPADGLIAVLTALGLALPAMGGGEALARAAHEFPAPRGRALKETGWLTVLFGVIVTAGGTLLFVWLVPADQRRLWASVPLLGIAHQLIAPAWLLDIIGLAVAAAAALLLFPVVHASLLDTEQFVYRMGVENILPRRFARLHPRFGTPATAMDTSAVAVIAAIIISGGRVPWLARAYAVALAVMLVLGVAALVRLRRTHEGTRPFRVPLDVRIGKRTLPLGLVGPGAAAAAGAAALAATGDIPALVTLCAIAAVTLAIVSRSRTVDAPEVADDGDTFDLLRAADLSRGPADVRPRNILVAVRNPHALAHLVAALRTSGDRDVVVMTARLIDVDVDETAAAQAPPTRYELELLSEIVAVAERETRRVHLLIVPAHNVVDAIVATILRLRSSDVYVGESSTLPAAEQARLLGEAWERSAKPDTFDVRLVVFHRSGRADPYHLGAHPPSLTPSDLELIHRVWVDASRSIGPHVHHHDVVRAALIQMEQQLNGPQRDAALASISDAARPAEELAGVLRSRDYARLRDMLRNRHASDVAALLTALTLEDQVLVFRVLPRRDAAAVFEYLSHEQQGTLLKALGQEDVAALLNNMAPDDRTQFLEELPAAATRQLLGLLTPQEREVARTLLGYPENSVGRLLTPHYVAVREHWTVREVLDHVRQHGQDSETLNVIYVVDEQGLLIDDIRIREFLLAPLDNRVVDLMDRRFVALTATDGQDAAVAVFRQYDRSALPVTDTAGMLIGIVTIDDVLDVAEATATREIQRIGGSEALDEPYIQIAFGRMIRKRAGWLTALFLGEMLTATAMGAFEAEIAKAVVLALFVPLIISSGGNSGSQAATLVIRALALGEVGLPDWWRIMRREIFAGIALGAILGAIGFLRITIWSAFSDMYGAHWLLVAITVGTSLIGVVLWGTLSGSLLPLLLRRLGFDPAASSAPFVATLVDVTGLVIYFSVASVVLRGTLL